MTIKQHITFWTALFCLFSTPKAHAIINGSLDTTHDCVGAVFYEDVAVTTGVLVDESWVLTVAHALDYAPASHFVIGNDFASLDSTVYAVDQIIVHPAYAMTGGIPANNFALLHLTAPVTGVDILPLMSSSNLFPGTNVLSVGYGDTSSTGSSNTRRRFIASTIDSTEASTFTLDFSSGGPCGADTGGACIISSGGADYIAGIISYGDCETYTVSGRVSSVYTFITDTIQGGGEDVNHIPSAPGLLSPSDQATSVNRDSVTFSWNPSTDEDGDTLTYSFYLSENSSFSGCTPVNVSARASNRVYAAGFLFSGFFLSFLLGGLRKKIQGIPLVCLAALLCVFTACSDSSDTPAPVNTTEGMSHVEEDLDPATTYYWKVVVDDGHGGVRSSEVRRFSTGAAAR